jgi:hypothetical protein
MPTHRAISGDTPVTMVASFREVGSTELGPDNLDNDAHVWLLNPVLRAFFTPEIRLSYSMWACGIADVPR